MAKPLAGKVCLVTGATRGIGKGIALQLGEAGATVYVTGRTLKKTGDLPGSLEDTVKEVEARGGQCIPVQCDHTNDEQVRGVFEKIKRDNGQLDILINNAYSAVTAISDNLGVPFWEQDDKMWDIVNIVGLRNHYICTVHAARMMVPRKQGLIVNISSAGGLRYLFNVPYGIGKAAMDRMAADCALELRKHKVAMVSIWPGTVKTELIKQYMKKAEESGSERGKRVTNIFATGETPEFSGKVIVALAKDPNLMKKSGHILLTADLGKEYNIRDIDGSEVQSFRSLSTLLLMSGWKRAAAVTPGFLKIPRFMLAIFSSKF